MTPNKVVPFVLLLASLVLTGCTTMADAVQSRGTGTKVAYQASFDEIWKALPEAINEAGLKFVSANREDRSVLAQRGITAFSYGENVAIFVEKVEETKSSVEVVSKKAMQTNIFAPDWAKPIFEQLDKRFKRS
jgi:predicted small secreted protein